MSKWSWIRWLKVKLSFKINKRVPRYPNQMLAKSQLVRAANKWLSHSQLLPTFDVIQWSSIIQLYQPLAQVTTASTTSLHSSYRSFNSFVFFLSTHPYTRSIVRIRWIGLTRNQMSTSYEWILNVWLTNCSEAEKAMFPLTHVQCTFIQAEKSGQPLRDFRADWQQFTVEMTSYFRPPFRRWMKTMIIAGCQINNALI